MKAKPIYDGRSIKLPNEADEMEDIGSLNNSRNVERLIAMKAFIYDDDGRQVSVRLERKRRGSEDGYWIAYKRAGGRLRKAYICEAMALDSWNLDTAAKRLLD